MAEMPAATEESREEVEWVMMVATAALLPLLQAFMAVLVVDLAGLGVGESFVRLCYLDELLLGGGIPTAGLLVQALIRIREGGQYGFLSGWYFLLRSR